MTKSNEVKMCAFCENPANLHGVCDECMEISLDIRESEKVNVWTLGRMTPEHEAMFEQAPSIICSKAN